MAMTIVVRSIAIVYMVVYFFVMVITVYVTATSGFSVVGVSLANGMSFHLICTSLFEIFGAIFLLLRGLAEGKIYLLREWTIFRLMQGIAMVVMSIFFVVYWTVTSKCDESSNCGAISDAGSILGLIAVSLDIIMTGPIACCAGLAVLHYFRGNGNGETNRIQPVDGVTGQNEKDPFQNDPTLIEGDDYKTDP